VPDYTTSVGSTAAHIAVLKRSQKNRVPATFKLFDTQAEMESAIAVERANIGLDAPVWFNGEHIEIATEPVGIYRRWKLVTNGGTSGANAAGSHARTVVVGTKVFLLPGDGNAVLQVTGVPSAGTGANGDLAIELDLGYVYSKTGGAWSLIASLGGGGGGLPDAPSNTALPVITGPTTTGSTLTVSNGAWTESPSFFSYQWYRAGVPISGQTTSSYTVLIGDIGLAITASVVASNGLNSDPAVSLAVLIPPPVPVGISGPTISGTPKAGFILTSTSGTWTNSPTGHSYEWRRNGTAVGGATDASTYACVTADVGATMTVAVKGVNAGGAAVTPLVSSATAAVAAADAQTGPDMPQSTADSFDTYIGGRLPTHAYVFGAEATAPAALTVGAVVNSVTAAQAAFHDDNDFTGDTKINSEAQTYGDIVANTHRIGADHLGLWAVLQSGQEWNVPFDSQTNSGLPIYLNGTTTPWANLPSTADFGVGQALMLAHAGRFVALLNKGIAYISSINPGANITFTPLADTPTSNHVNAMVGVLPIESTVCTSYVSGGTTLQFPANALSPNIKPGWAVALVVGNDVLRMTTDVKVVSVNIATGAVVINKSIPLSGVAGTRIAFHPHIAAGQLWSKDLFDIRPTRSRMAIEWDVDIFTGFSTEAAADLPRTGSRWDLRNTVLSYPDIPAGAWPALWFYSGNDGSTGTNGTSEGDPMELFMSCTMGARLFSTGNVGGGSALYNKTDDGWTVTSDNKNRMSTAKTMVGRHKIQYVYGWEPTNPALPEDVSTNPIRAVTWHYLDGVLIHKEPFQWMSARPAQLGMNVAMGWMSRPGAANFQIPLRTTSFQRANMDLHSLKVWMKVGA
jgi:hypothetical protein